MSQDKRFLLFLVSALTVMMLYMTVFNWLFPAPPPPIEEDKPVAEQVEKGKDGKKPGTAKSKEPPKIGAADPSENGKGKENGDDKENGNDNEALETSPLAQKFPHRLVAIGSLDAQSPFRFAAILDSRGGTVKWIELNERTSSGALRYRDLENPTGYLANLALTDEESGGCRVNVVVHGTPASQAIGPAGTKQRGLKAGDIVKKINDTAIKNTAEYEALMNGTRPGDEISISILREKKTIKFTAQLSPHPLAIIRPESTQLDEQKLAALKKLLVETLTKNKKPSGQVVPLLEQYGLILDDSQRSALQNLVQEAESDKFNERKSSALKQLLLELDDIVHHQQSFTLSLGNWTSNRRWNLFGGSVLESPEIVTENWETKPIKSADKPGVEFSYTVATPATGDNPSGRLRVVKRYLLAATPKDELDNRDFRSYHLEMEIEFKNVTPSKEEEKTSPLEFAYRLNGPRGLPLEGWWYANKIGPSWGASGARDVLWASEELAFQQWGCPRIVANILKEKKKANNRFFASFNNEVDAVRALRFAGSDTSYFAVLLQPADDESPEDYVYSHGQANVVGVVSPKDKGVRAKKHNTSFELISETSVLQPDESLKRKFIIFAGPKRPDLLAEYESRPIAYYGWQIFAMVSRPLVGLLHAFESIPGVNYGLAIIMLTVLVRSLMIPLSRKAVLNAQMMQVLSPEMKKIAEKYKNDMEKRNRAQQDLFRKYNYNPFGGCLLMFVQLPIFIGLYRGLAVDIELRGQPLIPGVSWCSNLAGPDKLFYWGDWMWSFLASETGWLGPYFNILPVITMVLFIVQQKMFTPPPQDEQQEMTQKMMMWMTVAIGFMFFKVPSGLCVYFITSSLWGVAERKLLPKPKLPEHLQARGEGGKGSDGKGPGGSAPKPTPKSGPNGAERKSKKKKKRKKTKGRR